MKLIRLSLVAAVIASSLVADLITVSGDITFTSNSLWRGGSGTDDTATVQGTIGVEHESGVYAGAWGTGLAVGSEIDLYVGYATEFSGLGLDMGFIAYTYTVRNDAGTEYDHKFDEYGEAYLGLSYDLGVEIGATFYKGLMSEDKDSTIVEASLGKDFGVMYVGAAYGMQLDEESGDDYYSATIGMPFESIKGDLSLTYANTDAEDSDAVFAVTYTTSF